MFRCEACSGRGWIPVVAADGNVLRVIDALPCPECQELKLELPGDQEADVSEVDNVAP